MAKIVALCGKLCAGKSTLARQLSDELSAVILCSDELTLALPFDHDDTYPVVRPYLMRKAAEIARAGANVILDFGFWSRAERDEARAFFAQEGVALKWRYVPVTDGEWRRNIAARNDQVRRGETHAYFVDEGLMQKCLQLFEEPQADEFMQ